jgi:hypothetical protein
VYLADLRLKSFTHTELHIASHLGIGLIQIKAAKCIEVISSPVYKPMQRLNLQLLEALKLGRCQLCDSIFNIGDPDGGSHRFSNLARENLRKALSAEKGLMFWNREVADRKNKLRLRVTPDGMSFERRFICPDCVFHVVSQLVPQDGK